MRPADETRNIYVGDVIHRSVLKVDEEGAEAGVTSVDFRVTSLPVYDFRFQADRPFVVVIRDDATGALLFVGAVTDTKSVSRSRPASLAAASRHASVGPRRRQKPGYRISMGPMTLRPNPPKRADSNAKTNQMTMAAGMVATAHLIIRTTMDQTAF